MTVLFGYDIVNVNSHSVNIVIMYAKKYIYQCKMNLAMPRLNGFKQYMRTCMNIIVETNCKYSDVYKMLSDMYS